MTGVQTCALPILIVFTIPVFAVICDWTEGFTVLLNEGDLDHEKYNAKQRRVKCVFLTVSTLIVVAMWISVVFNIMNSFTYFHRLIPDIVQVCVWMAKIIMLIIMAFVLAVMIQIVVLYLRVIRVLKELQQLILKHYKDQQPEDQNQFMVDGIQATFEKDDPPAQHVHESSKSPQSIQVTDSMISFDQHDIKSIRRNKPTF